jgi:hypothetical protein
MSNPNSPNLKGSRSCTFPSYNFFVVPWIYSDSDKLLGKSGFFLITLKLLLSDLVHGAYPRPGSGSKRLKCGYFSLLLHETFEIYVIP